MENDKFSDDEKLAELSMAALEMDYFDVESEKNVLRSN